MDIIPQDRDWVNETKKRLTSLFKKDKLDRTPFIFNILQAKTFDDDLKESLQPSINLKPDFSNADLFQLSLDKLRYFRSKVKEKIPIGLPDIQSPLDTAAIMMNDTEFLVAMKTHPGEIHKSLKMISEVIIESVHKVMKESAVEFSASHGHWLPYGIWMSDDMLSVLSPELYAEIKSIVDDENLFDRKNVKL